jgi:peptidoglycan/xylan/chitin deacetylase (PgdA/CDA1 family)
LIARHSPDVLGQMFRDVLFHGDRKHKVIHLTFDDGPIPEVTPEVLSILDTFEIKATFFCVGDNIRKHPAIFQRILDAGHAVGNHTFNHLNGWKTQRDRYLKNVRLFETQHKTSLFRPPYGKMTPKQYLGLKDQFKIVMWDVLSKDYSHDLSAEACLKRSVSLTRNGSIIVFHDNLKTADKLLYILPKYIQHFKDLGYSFSTLG